MNDAEQKRKNDEITEAFQEPFSGKWIYTLSDVVDSIPGWIYVVDSQSYRICYVNRRIKTISPEAEVGEYCYKAFMNMDCLCETCPAYDAVKENKFVTREFYNAHLGIWTRVNATPVKWQGRDTVLLQLQDVTDFKEECAAGRMNHSESGESVNWDALTNLYTAGAFSMLAEMYLESRSSEEPSAILMLDMDDFEKVNQQRGEIFGNVVLMNVASCLKRVCAEGDLIGRFGGDEFLVLLKNRDKEGAGKIATSISREIERILLEVKPEDTRMSCSIGIYMIEKEDRKFPDIASKAVLAVRSVKTSGKNGIRFYDTLPFLTGGKVENRSFWQLNEQKRRGQRSLHGKTTTAVALEVFEKSSTFEEAIHILMGFMGSRFRLNRIGLYLNGWEGVTKQAFYQWVDESTAMLMDPSDAYRKEEFYLCYNLYNEDHIAILEESKYEEYTRGIKGIMDRAQARTILFAGVFIEGRYSGMLAMVNTERGRQWSKAECTAISEVARILASNAVTSVRLMEARQELEYYKNRDSLTGLLRYDKFKEECQQILDAREGEYALVASDIKGFKFINEAIGYTQGDNVLRMFTDMLIQNGSETNRHTRVTADQFMTFGKIRGERNDFVKLVQDMNDEFCQVQNEIYPKVNMRIRSGIYFVEKECCEIKAAIDRATIARKSVDYIIKSATVVFNDGPFDSKFRENEIINRMEYALKHGEFKVFFQPKFSLKDHHIVGAEALVRWQREDGSLMQPGDFVPLFEKNGFLSQVDLYVFEQVCKGLRAWEDEGGSLLPVSINLSSVDIQSGLVVSKVLEHTANYGIEHRYLEFELTETAFLTETELTYKVMNTLQELGFTTSIDDFGSGYSIMNMMAEIPTDIIKLDCAFVQTCSHSERGREFLGQLIQMTNKMGFTSLCEGIETEEQLNMLTEMGCELGQGYYFSMPIPMEEFFPKFCLKKD